MLEQNWKLFSSVSEYMRGLPASKDRRILENKINDYEAPRQKYAIVFYPFLLH